MSHVDESRTENGLHHPETSPLRDLYATWLQRFESQLTRGWERKLAALIPELRQQYPNKLKRANKQHDQLLGLPPEFWALWQQGYIDDILPFMDEAARISAGIAEVDVDARFSISAEPGIVDSDIAAWANEHTMQLVSERSRLFRQTLTQTDIRMLQNHIAAWVETGGTFPELVERLSRVVVNPARARIIAATEATRAYAEGQRLYWEATGVVNAERWNTARDELVCPICKPLDTNVRELGVFDGPPAHVSCRCWVTPVVSREDTGELRPAGVGGGAPAETINLPDSNNPSVTDQEISDARGRIANLSADQVSRLTPEELVNLQDYTNSAFKNVNNYLRVGEAGDLPIPSIRSVVNGIDDAMVKSALDADAVVYRAGRLPFELTDDVIGTVFEDAAYVSTSFDSSTAASFLDDVGEHIIEIRVPSGTNAIATQEISHAAHEMELLLGRNTRFKVAEVGQFIDHFSGDTLPKVVLEVLSP